MVFNTNKRFMGKKKKVWLVSYINSVTSLSCRNRLEREEKGIRMRTIKIHEPLWKRLIKEQGAPRCTGGSFKADERRYFTWDTVKDVEVHPHHSAEVKQPQGFGNADPNSRQTTCWRPSLPWLTNYKHIWLRKPLSYESLEAEVLCNAATCLTSSYSSPGTSSGYY